MRFNKLQNLSLRVETGELPKDSNGQPINPFGATSFKRVLFDWALKKGEFTKQEFWDAVIELRDEYEVESVQDDDTLPRAWFGEFTKKKSRYGQLFVLADR